MSAPTAPAVQYTAPQIKVDGVLLPDAWLANLRSARVRAELSVVRRTTLTFNDTGYALAANTIFTLGKAVYIEIDNIPVFKGFVTGSSLEHERSSQPRLVITADDAGFRLGLTQRMKPYVNMSYSDILSSILSNYSMTANVQGGTATLDHVVQRTSDLAFVEMIVRRMNRVWWIDDTTLHVAEPAAASTPVNLDGAQELKEFSVRASGLRPLEVDVHGWDLKQKQNIVGVANGAAAPSTARSAFVTDYVGSAPGTKLGTAGAKVLTTVSNPLNQDEAATMASAQVASWGSASVIARGTVDPAASALALNGQVEVTNVGPMSGTYTVTSVEHSYDGRGLVTHFVCGSLRPAGLVDSLATAAVIDDGLTVRSLSTGIVTNNKDPDNLGRVKVQLAGTDETVESDWARVMTLGGGANRGVVFHPEVNDEVVVAFERGDTRRPVVLGGLANGKDLLSAAGDVLNESSGKVDFRRMTSRLGHIVELADGETPDKKHILLQHANETNKVRLGDDEMTIDLPAGKKFTLTVGSAKIAIDDQGNISIEGLKITLKSNTDIELTATTKLAAKGLQLDLSATSDAKLSAPMVAVEGQGQATLKGGVVMIN